MKSLNERKELAFVFCYPVSLLQIGQAESDIFYDRSS